MKNLQYHLNRRRVLTSALALSCVTTILATPSLAKDGGAKDVSYGSAKILMEYEGRKIGLKISRLKDGSGVITAREIGGKRLFARKITGSSEPTGKTKLTVTGPNREKFSVYDKTNWGAASGKYKLAFGSDLKGLKISTDMSTPGEDMPDESSEAGKWYNFWDWVNNLGDSFHDVVTAIGAAATLITGGQGSWTFSNGGRFYIAVDGGFEYYGNNDRDNFKLEPGMEDNPLWY